MNFRRTVIAALASVALLAAPNVWAGNGQSLLQHVPSQAAVVVNVDLEQLRSLPIYQILWGAVTANPDAQEALTQMQEQAGFDPNTDLRGLVIMLSGDDDDKWGLLVEGNFNVSRIATYLATLDASEMATHEYQGHTVYFDPTDSETDRSYFAFLSDNVVAAGTQAELSAILDTGAGGANVTTNTGLNPLISSVDSTGIFWFAGVMSPSMQAEMVGSPMEGMTNMHGSANFAGGLNFAYTLGTASAENAGSMSTFFNEQMAAARTAPEIQQMGLGSVLDSVNVAADGNNVTISASIPEETVNQIIGMLSAIMAAQAGGGGGMPE